MPLEAYRDGVFSTATPRYGFQHDSLEAFRDGALGAAVTHFGPTAPSWAAAKMRAELAHGRAMTGLGAARTYFGPSSSSYAATKAMRARASLMPRNARLDGFGWFGAEAATVPVPVPVEAGGPGVMMGASGVGGFIGGFIGATIGAAIGVWAVMRRRG